jgi:hypothetical protein
VKHCPTYYNKTAEGICEQISCSFIIAEEGNNKNICKDYGCVYMNVSGNNNNSNECEEYFMLNDDNICLFEGCDKIKKKENETVENLKKNCLDKNKTYDNDCKYEEFGEGLCVEKCIENFEEDNDNDICKFSIKCDDLIKNNSYDNETLFAEYCKENYCILKKGENYCNYDWIYSEKSCDLNW